MALRLFNTLKRQVEVFTLLDPAKPLVGMYCCGPTVYDFAHIGNYRTFVFADFVRRYLEFSGFQVNHVMNITDVEDKIIARVQSANVDLRTYTAKYENAFLEDIDSLRCVRPHHLPRATDHIPEIIQLIQRLIDRGIAYQAADRSVYFSIDRYRGCGCRYGQLLNLDLQALRPGERISNDEYAKEAIADFALWKARVPKDGAVSWPSPWGEGRPGWHVECSAMSMKLLGPTFDIHLGGEDLIFPHHEDEIAQSEGAALQPPGQPFVRYWLHGAHLLVEGKKMSKSLGNYFTLRDLLNQGFAGREIRYLLLSAHYRETFNFTLDNLQGARTALSRIDDCIARARELAGPEPAPPDASILNAIRTALDDDLNVSAAWAALFDWIRDLNRQLAANTLSSKQAAAAIAAWDSVDRILAVSPQQGPVIPEHLLSLLEQRQNARKARDFKTADAIRDSLLAQGWTIDDTPKGPRLKPR